MPLQDLDPTRRFSDRVNDYVKYRPSYPEALLAYLNTRVGGLSRCRVADIGSGTGIFSKLLLDQAAFGCP
jgi:hypothetical protein